MEDENVVVPLDGQLGLRTLLKAAGYLTSRMGTQRQAMYFSGRTREWNLVARVDDGWFNLSTFVCPIPKESGMSGRLLASVMAENQRMRLSKFVTRSGTLVLELDFPAKHLDTPTLQELVGVLFSNAEECYPGIFRIVSGDDVLEALAEPAPSDGGWPAWARRSIMLSSTGCITRNSCTSTKASERGYSIGRSTRTRTRPACQPCGAA